MSPIGNSQLKLGQFLAMCNQDTTTTNNNNPARQAARFD
jgi:hypothetical protein